MALLKPVIQACFALLPFIAVYVFLRKSARVRPSYRSVAVLVLGDMGRSPRMMYHAQSFAQLELETFVVGYKGTPPPAMLRSLPHTHFMYLSPPPGFISKLPRAAFLLFAPFKVLYQSATILHALLFRMPYPPEYLMVQNPPTIPTLAIVQFICWWRGTKLIIDWHNLGYSILAMRLGRSHRIVKLAEWFERTFGRSAYAHLFVTNAMRKFLTREWKLQGHTAVLHDRPPAHFHPCSASEVHNLFVDFPTLAPPITTDFYPSYTSPTSTPFTQIAPASTAIATSLASAASFSPEALPTLRTDRPALVVSSTSWTADEDFSVLLEALTIYEHRAREVNKNAKNDSERLPKMLMIVTGRGDLREKYMREVRTLEGAGKWEYVRCRSVWMSTSDYPLLLGSADLGVSLHSSSSALDLPMKVVDMFGCGLPVCALDFASLDELVKDGLNGVVFRTAAELAQHFETLLRGFPSEESALAKLRTSLQECLNAPKTYPNTLPSSTWEWGTWGENWNRVVRPLVLDVRYSSPF